MADSDFLVVCLETGPVDLLESAATSQHYNSSWSPSVIMAHATGDERVWRLQQLAQEYNIEDRDEKTPLSRPLTTPSLLTTNPNDPDAEKKADDLLRRRRLAKTQDQNGNSGGGTLKKRPFTLTRKESFASKEIFDTLDAHVANAGTPVVAEALLYKLRVAGGDLNRANTKSKTPFHLRRKSLDDLGREQSRILQKAVENGQEDMVAVLVPHADPETLDAALPLAIRTGNLKVTETLLRYGANLSHTPDGPFLFRQMCINGGQADLVGLILRTDGRPAPEWISGAMIDAAKKGCVGTVLRLSRSVADGSFDDGAALKEAISQCRVDVALAILTGSKPPNKQCLNQAFMRVHTHTAMMPPEKLKLTHALLLAGAEGDVISAALVKACDTEFYDMIGLLLSSGASVEFKGALVIKNAIERGNTGLVQMLLSDKTNLSPVTAADLIGKIPKRINPEDRRLLLSILLRKGAKGAPVDDALISAVESGDFECVKLLLTAKSLPPGELQLKGAHEVQRGTRHAVADVNHKGGLALLRAIQSGNLPIVSFILSAKPTLETRVAAFPSINKLKPAERYVMTESFLNAGVSGPCVHAALQNAIDETPPRRDNRLINMLLQYDVDMADDGAPLLSAIEQQDTDLLQALLMRRPTTTINASVALTRAMAVEDQDKRVLMASLLLQAGADGATNTVSEVMKNVIQQQPTDIQLLGVLLRQGNADINMDKGDAVALGNIFCNARPTKSR